MYFEVIQLLVVVAGIRPKDTSEMETSFEVLPLYPLRATRDEAGHPDATDLTRDNSPRES